MDNFSETFPGLSRVCVAFPDLIKKISLSCREDAACLCMGNTPYPIAGRGLVMVNRALLDYREHKFSSVLQ